VKALHRMHSFERMEFEKEGTAGKKANSTNELLNLQALATLYVSD
jgi:hypothetical protein